jgi:rubredoxin
MASPSVTPIPVDRADEYDHTLLEGRVVTMIEGVAYFVLPGWVEPESVVYATYAVPVDDVPMFGGIMQGYEASIDPDNMEASWHNPEERALFRLEEGKLPATYSIPMILTCPECGERHIDEGEFEHVPHRVHACQSCGHVWQPAKVNTHGVRFLPGYKNDD